MAAGLQSTAYYQLNTLSSMQVVRSARRIALPLLRQAACSTACQRLSVGTQATQHQAPTSMAALQQVPANFGLQPVLPQHQGYHTLQQQSQHYQQPVHQSHYQQAQQSYASVADSGTEYAGDEEQPGICDYEAHCINAVALTGMVLSAPTLTIFPSGKAKTQLRIMTFAKTYGRPWPVQVEAWDAVARNVTNHCSVGSIICINGRLGPPYRDSGLKVVVEEFWAVDHSSIPQEALASLQQAVDSYTPSHQQQQQRGRNSNVPAASIWQRYTENGADMRTIAQELELDLGTVHEKLVQASRDNWQVDWPRVCTELGLDTGAGGVAGGVPLQQLAAVMDAAHAANPTAVTKDGEPLKKVARDAVLADAQLGPVVAAQEQQPDGLSLTYMQLRTVNVMKRLGLDLAALAEQ